SFGYFGLLILSALDSTVFFFMPFAIDFLFIAQVSRHRAEFPNYLLTTVCGSMAGCFLTYWIVSKTSEKTLERHLPKKKFEKLKKKIDEKGFYAVLFTAILPPPFPFSPFVLAASIAKMSLKKLMGGVFTGRTLRFLLEGILAFFLGRRILRLLNSHVLKFTMLGIAVLAIIGTSISIYKWTRKPA
ncbi:MAG TPA: VTT domain-containing protein, partial [Acidobacteriota bacterium]